MLATFMFSLFKALEIIVLKALFLLHGQWGAFNHLFLQRNIRV